MLEGDEVSMEVPADAFEMNDGSAPPDNVAVYAGFVDPESPSFGEQMPGGDLTAESTGGEEGVLVSFGAVTVEATDMQGNEVQIKKPVRICIKIPAGLVASAPDSIALWDMRDSVWRERGTAQREGNQYCFDSDGLGSINCDLFSRSAILTGQVCDPDGKPVADAPVRVGQLMTRTGSDGMYSVVFPTTASTSISSGTLQETLSAPEASVAYEVNLGPCPDNDGGVGGGCEGDSEGCDLSECEERTMQLEEAGRKACGIDGEAVLHYECSVSVDKGCEELLSTMLDCFSAAGTIECQSDVGYNAAVFPNTICIEESKAYLKCSGLGVDDFEIYWWELVHD